MSEEIKKSSLPATTVASRGGTRLVEGKERFGSPGRSYPLAEYAWRDTRKVSRCQGTERPAFLKKSREEGRQKRRSRGGEKRLGDE